ncbi:unnamed protein product [Adineta ricciae]|uniref:Uncharacterized protein n=1 Tax=Adineta ricciae TaxID=249248 RepID=A0A813W683_ADIRI|nr:unnamed protein product [Adineta ricciae]
MKRLHRHRRRRSSSTARSSTSLNSSNSSLASLITSVRDFSLTLNHGLLQRELFSENKPLQERKSIDYTPSCTTCCQFNSTAEYDACSRCREKQLVTRSDSLPSDSTDSSSDKELTRSTMFYIDNVYDKYEDLRNVHKDHNQLQRQCVKHLANAYRLQYVHSLTSSDSSLTQQMPTEQHKPSCERKVTEMKSYSSSMTNCSYKVCLSPERIQYYQQRQVELDRACKKLLESLAIKTNENISEISKHWSYIKQTSLKEFRPQTVHLNLYDSLLQKTPLNKSSESYIADHDGIQAAFEILQQILAIFRGKYTLLSLHELFDSIEKNMLQNLHAQLESLVSSYKDELSFICERIHFYQSRTNGDKNFEWTHSIKVDYPVLIEKISDDFIIRVPQIDQTLIQMLRNMKKELLHFLIDKM